MTKVVFALLLILISPLRVKAQDIYDEFSTSQISITDSTYYLLRDDDGWYMKAGYDATNRLRLLSTRKKDEASAFYFRRWYGDIYFVSVQMKGDEKCFLSRSDYGALVFFPGFAYEESRFGWDCSYGCMSISTARRGWTTCYYLHCDNGSWDLSQYEMSPITMLQINPSNGSKGIIGHSTGISETSNEENSEHAIFTISGAKVKGKPTRHGIYIVDGHKVVY